MPQLPVTVNANITRIDAPFPEQWRDELFQFTKEITAIKELMAVVATSLTQSTEARSTLAELYKKESIAERASQAIASEQSQHRPTNPQGEEAGASRPEEVFRSPAPPAGSPGQERQEREERERGGGPSPTASTPYQETLDYLSENPITMPQHYGGRYTATDLLNLMAQGARRANARFNPAFDEEGNPLSGGAEGTGLARATELLSRGSSTWVPNIQAGIGLAKAYGGAAKSWSEGLGSYSGSLGYEPGSGFLGMNNISGPFGTNFRMPLLNSAALSGLTQTAEAYSTALTVPGLSGSQAMAMNQSLAERGWFPGQEGQQKLFDAQAHLIGKGGVFQALGENPEIANLLDHGMRGGQAGMEEMVRTIEEIPEAAKHAHEGVGQMVQSMNELGEFSQSQGGSHYAGQQQALDLANTTGVPVQATKGLVESPWATSAIFRQTGMPSWMQGTIPGAIKNEAAMNSFWQLSRAVGKGEGHTYRSGGFEMHVSPLEEQAARMHMLLPNMNPEAITRLLREGRQGVRGRAEVQKQAEMWEKTARQYMGTGHTGLENQLLTATNVGKANFGRLIHNMEQQRTEDGRRMFSGEDIRNIRSNFGQGYEGHGQQLVEEKYKSIQEILGTKAGKDANAAGSPGNVVIELSPAAKKLLQLPNKQSRIKLEAGAGENATVNGFAGSTDPLTPATAFGYATGHGVPLR